jgi:acyl-CoA synthetase (NDP forming)
VAELLACYGLPTVEQRIVRTPDEAGAAAAALGGDVALKAVAPGVVHKTELGAVRLRLRGADQVAREAAQMAARLAGAGAPPTGFVVQRMAAGGAELLAGIVHDPQFGPVLACGAGGVTAELLKDVAVRLTPITRPDAHAMLLDLKTFPLLAGYRGGPAYDVGALEDVLVRLGAMADALPQIAELDCTPVIVSEQGATIVDARVRLQAAPPPRPLGARRDPA